MRTVSLFSWLCCHLSCCNRKLSETAVHNLFNLKTPIKNKVMSTSDSSSTAVLIFRMSRGLRWWNYSLFLFNRLQIEDEDEAQIKKDQDQDVSERRQRKQSGITTQFSCKISRFFLSLLKKVLLCSSVSLTRSTGNSQSGVSLNKSVMENTPSAWKWVKVQQFR